MKWDIQSNTTLFIEHFENNNVVNQSAFKVKDSMKYKIWTKRKNWNKIHPLFIQGSGDDPSCKQRKFLKKGLVANSATYFHFTFSLPFASVWETFVSVCTKNFTSNNYI